MHSSSCELCIYERKLTIYLQIRYGVQSAHCRIENSMDFLEERPEVAPRTDEYGQNFCHWLTVYAEERKVWRRRGIESASQQSYAFPLLFRAFDWSFACKISFSPCNSLPEDIALYPLERFFLLLNATPVDHRRREGERERGRDTNFLYFFSLN